jgi:hypothetical protein
VWQGGWDYTAQGIARPGSALSFGHQGPNQLDLLFVDNQGAVNVMWVNGFYGIWAAPCAISAAGTAEPGSPVAVANQGSIDQLDLAFVGYDGALYLMWVVNGHSYWAGA